MRKVGITIGKFKPLHKGHELLIEFGAKLLDELTVVVSDRIDDNQGVATVAQRYGWVCDFVEARKLDNVTVVFHIDESPEPVEIDEHGTVLDREFQDYWKREFQTIAPDATHFVSSDLYGKTVAELLDIKWLPVDPKRELVDISATRIRNNPRQHFNMISDVAKPNFVKKIAVVGPESTGKSTMVKQLARWIEATTVPEYGRTLSEVKENDLTEEDFFDIMRGQQVMIDLAVRNSTTNCVFIDTEAYTTYLFSKIYLREYVPELLEFARNQEIDHYIVLAPTVSWINDGTRVLGDEDKRKKFYDELVDLLKHHKRPFTVIDPERYESRLVQAIDVSTNLLLT